MFHDDDLTAKLTVLDLLNHDELVEVMYTKVVELWSGYNFDLEINSKFPLDPELYQAKVGSIQLEWHL